MPTLNKMQIMGNLGADAELRMNPGGSKCIRFTVAVTERWTDRNSGERKSETTWFNVQRWVKENHALLDYLKKGQAVFVEGKMRSYKGTRKNSTVEETFWTLIAENIQLCGSRDRGAGAPPTAGDATVDDVHEISDDELASTMGDDIPF